MCPKWLLCLKQLSTKWWMKMLTTTKKLAEELEEINGKMDDPWVDSADSPIASWA